MSQIQNNTLHNFVQPGLFVGAAFLAGRFIQYFPGATQEGLILSAGLGSCATLISQKFYSTDEESPLHSFMRVTASLALGAIAAPYVGKALNGRADITLPAALRFVAVETVLAGVLSIVSSQIAEPIRPPVDPKLKAEHDKYSNDIDSWNELCEEKCSELIKKFFDADLPPISLADVSVQDDVFEKYCDYSKLSAHQLGWHVEDWLHQHDYDPVEVFGLNLALQAKNLPIVWDFNGVTWQQIEYAEGKPECVDLLHSYFTNHPIQFAIKEEKRLGMKDLFDGKPPIPSPQDYFQRIQPDDYQELEEDEVEFLVEKILEDEIQMTHVSPEQLTALLGAASYYNMFDALDLLNEDVVTRVLGNEAAIRALHEVFEEEFLFYAMIDADQRERLRAAFDHQSFNPITSPLDYLQEHTSDISHFSKNFVCSWREYFIRNDEKWKGLSSELVAELVIAFTRASAGALSIEGIEIDKETLNNHSTIPDLESIEEMEEINEIHWYLAIHQKIGDFLDEEAHTELKRKLEELTNLYDEFYVEDIDANWKLFGFQVGED